MKKKFTLTGALRHVVLSLALMLGLVANAQNVTVSTETGEMLPTLQEGYTEAGFAAGAFAIWHHYQLELVLIASDNTTLSSAGILVDHANNFYPASEGTGLIVYGGMNEMGYMSVSLPRGYRFTGYKIVVQNNVDLLGEGEGQLTIDHSKNTYFGETDSKFAYKEGYYEDLGLEMNDTEYTISRTADDMGNVLYFKVANDEKENEQTTGEGVFLGCTMKYIEFTFTAEEGADNLVAPNETFDEGVSYVEVPFYTGKLDLGEVESHTYDETTRASYYYTNVSDLGGSMLFYEEASVDANAAIPDRTVGTATGNKSITGVKDSEGTYYYKIDGNNTYYIETPVKAAQVGGAEIPLHYRITGATLHFSAKAHNTARTNYTISQEVGNYWKKTYYLNLVDGALNYTNTSATTNWYMDDEGYVYTRVGSNVYYIGFTATPVTSTLYIEKDGTYYYGTFPTSYTYTLKVVANKSFAAKWTKDSSNRIYFTDTETVASYETQYRGWDAYNFYKGYVDKDFTMYLTRSDNAAALTGNYRSYGASTFNSINVAGTSSSDLAGFTATIYGTDGEKPVATIDVPAGGTADYELTDLNNDAVKFKVSGDALVNADIVMESLNPYIDQMSVICEDVRGTGKGLTISQKFTSDDFAVGGGDFYFNLPDICEGNDCEIHFGDLYSKYGDETYYTGTAKQSNGNARYSFVMADYYKEFESGNDYNIYTNTDAAADFDYTKKTYVTTVGATAFKFNNAEDLQGETGFLTEYPFTVDTYTKAGGSFKTIEFEYISSNEYDDQEAFVFTSDETRYNIAPTTGTEHRYYAYYDIRIHVKAEPNTPTLTLDPVYEEGSTLNTNVESPAYYGLTVKVQSDTWHECFTDNGTVIKALKEAVEKEKTSLDKILYIDFSKMIGILELDFSNVQASSDYSAKEKAMLEENKENYISLEELRKQLAPNALIFMPEKQTYDADNFVVLTDKENQVYKASMNIILTDKEAFYNPYDFTVDAANYAKYTRGITADHGQVTNSTLIIPFSVEVEGDEGLHVNKVDNCKMLFKEMQANNCLSDGKDAEDKPYNIGDNLSEQEGEDFLGYAHFVGVKGKTEPNMPYFVQVTEYNGGDDASFSIAQKGASFASTVAHLQQPKLVGSTAKGSISTTTSEEGSEEVETETTNLEITQYGTYSGYKVPAEKSIFYFQKSKFVSAGNLNSKWTEVYILPFRTWYDAQGMTSTTKFNLGVIFGENTNTEGATVINQVAASASDLAVVPGVGTLTFVAKSAQTVSVYTAGGQHVARLTLGDGAQKTIAVPAGIYVVNGQKMLVK